jgi:hypothetical protein
MDYVVFLKGKGRFLRASRRFSSSQPPRSGRRGRNATSTSWAFGWSLKIAVDSEGIAAQEGGGAAASKNTRYGDNFQYGTTGYLNVREVLGVVKPFGCGMGRILFVAASKTCAKVYRDRMLEPLSEIAQCNAASLRGRKAPIEIVCGDAPRVDRSDGIIYFMFNPYAETLHDTLESIRGSLSQKPPAIKIAYYRWNSDHASCFLYANRLH